MPPSTPQYELLTDDALLELYVRLRDEEAFREIARRHWRLVFSVCLRVLRDEHAAEDAFQNTFVILARSGHRIRQRESLPSWLHGVALRTSIRAWSRRQRRREVELREDVMNQDDVLAEVSRRHTERVFDEELQQLPEKYRAPLLLHYVTGKSRSEIADQLGMSLNVVKGRLQRGRRCLRIRLAARGIQFAVAAMFVQQSWEATTATAAETMIELAATAPHGPSTATGSTDYTVSGTGALTMSSWFATCLATAASFALLLVFLGQNTIAADPAPELTLEAVPRGDVDNDDRPVPLLAAASAQEQPQSNPNNDQSKSESPSKPVVSLKYGDGKADGKKSLGGTGEMIRFELPDKSQKVRGLRIHSARYGHAKAPDEDVEITFEDDQRSEIVDTRSVPYSKFRKGTSRWVTLKFNEPIEVPEAFWVTIDFAAERTKGVYVSYDSSTGGKHSRSGVPGAESKPVTFGGDWMIQALLTKPAK